MVRLKSCLCWEDLRVPSAVTAAFSMTISFVQIMLQIAFWTTFQHVKELLRITVVVLYVPVMVLDLLIIVTGALFLVGVEKGSAGRVLLMPWMSITVLHTVYETAVNMYLFNSSSAILYSLHELTVNNGDFPRVDLMSAFSVFVVYWAIKLIVNLGGLVCVISHFQRFKKGKMHEEAMLTGWNPFGMNWFNQANYPYQYNTRYKPNPFRNPQDVVQNPMVDRKWIDAAELAEPRFTGLEGFGGRSQPVFGNVQYQRHDNKTRYPYWYQPVPQSAYRPWYNYDQNWY